MKAEGGPEGRVRRLRRRFRPRTRPRVEGLSFNRLIPNIMTMLGLCCGLVAAIAMRMDVPHPVLLALFLALCAGWYWLTRDRARAVGFFRALRRNETASQATEAEL